MTNEERVAAQKLLQRINREVKVARSVGVGKGADGRTVLVPILEREPLIMPEEFLGFPVVPVEDGAVREVSA